MTAPLLCANCGCEIVPGTLVNFVGPDFDPDGGNQIITPDDDVMVVHAQCPDDDS